MSEPTVPNRAEDDSDVGWGERQDDDADGRLREERPPHHDERS